VAGRHLAVAARQQEQDRQRADPAPEHRDHVEGRVVGPVHVLEHEHGRRRRQPQLRQQQAVDLVRGGAARERAPELRPDRVGEVVQRPERPRDREVVAGPDEDARARADVADEARDERRLADPRLARDDDDPPFAAARRVPRRREPRQRALALEQLHAPRIDPCSRRDYAAGFTEAT
jgi:hypothetical protein